MIVDLTAPTWIGTLVFHEFYNSSCGGICLDWITLYVSNDAGGPWAEVFYWGDSNDGNNGSIPSYHFPPENDNEPVPSGELYPPGTGIGIGVGATYRYILITAPPGCGDGAQIDSFEILP